MGGTEPDVNRSILQPCLRAIDCSICSCVRGKLEGVSDVAASSRGDSGTRKFGTGRTRIFGGSRLDAEATAMRHDSSIFLSVGMMIVAAQSL